MKRTKFNFWLKTFTKRAVTAILVFSLLDMQLSYVLAFLGKEQIAEQLSSTVASMLVGVMLGYFMKALFETFFEEREKRLCNMKEGDSNDDTIYDDGTSGGFSDH